MKLLHAKLTRTIIGCRFQTLHPKQSWMNGTPRQKKQNTILFILSIHVIYGLPQARRTSSKS